MNYHQCQFLCCCPPNLSKSYFSQWVSDLAFNILPKLRGTTNPWQQKRYPCVVNQSLCCTWATILLYVYVALYLLSSLIKQTLKRIIIVFPFSLSYICKITFQKFFIWPQEWEWAIEKPANFFWDSLLNALVIIIVNVLATALHLLFRVEWVNHILGKIQCHLGSGGSWSVW